MQWWQHTHSPTHTYTPTHQTHVYIYTHTTDSVPYFGLGRALCVCVCVCVCVCCYKFWCSVEYTGAMQRGPDDVCGSEPRGALDWRESAFSCNDAAALSLSLCLSLSLSLRVSLPPCLTSFLCTCFYFYVSISLKKCNQFILPSWPNDNNGKSRHTYFLKDIQY